ncbi:amino acid permease [Nonomuraea africana]|uniref:Amino acid transporter n=1 Tax=Nonomuraea africana TaxID=46171 RepID=A0ABR9KBQ1_9ACTN|nr:amino acid permease [Nonomuraea africana]MBE1559446.1 amino acid transporter [Nonomuraea africana]
MTSTDDGRLADLGYTSEFRRDMSLWANFSLGFTYLSPVVGIYTLFAVSLATGGPPMIWSLLIVGAGQFLVALVFGEIVSQYPLTGGIYPWARRLWGRRWAWMTGWVYLIALLVTIASVAYGAGPYLSAFLGIEVGTTNTILCALVILAVAVAINLAGTRALAMAAIVGFTAELVGALAVGGWLLFTQRHHGLGVLFDSFGAGAETGYFAAFLAAGLIGIFQYYGFEACGDVAEEVPDPTRRIPKAMRMTIYVGGAAATFVCLALLLAVPDFGAVISGASADPVSEVLTAAFGPTGLRVVLGVVLLSFLSCALSLQAAAGRLLYSYARDGMIAGSGLFRRFSAARHVPPYALLVAAVVPALVVLGSIISADALVKIISFATLGIYLGFQMVVLAALRARLRGWRPSGPFTLGTAGLAINVGALVYGVLAIVNMIWPRTPGAPWYDNWLVALSGLVVVGLGALYLFTARPYDGVAPAGDAIPQEERSTAAE